MNPRVLYFFLILNLLIRVEAKKSNETENEKLFHKKKKSRVGDIDIDKTCLFYAIELIDGTLITSFPINH